MLISTPALPDESYLLLESSSFDVSSISNISLSLTIVEDTQGGFSHSSWIFKIVDVNSITYHLKPSLSMLAKLLVITYILSTVSSTMDKSLGGVISYKKRIVRTPSRLTPSTSRDG